MAFFRKVAAQGKKWKYVTCRPNAMQNESHHRPPEQSSDENGASIGRKACLRSGTMYIPFFGRSVTRGLGLTSKPGATRSFHFWATEAITRTDSIQAKRSPTHSLSPPP